jgi:glycosyltransferase involved in cell wall biosynthesis
MSAAVVTIVIPVYGRWQLLELTLQSALDQEDVDYEVILVDDASPDDGTAEWLRRLEHPRVRVVRHEASQGAARARNHGMLEAATPWVSFLDSDDLWAPRKLRAQLDQAAANDAVWVYSDAIDLNERGDAVGLEQPPPPAAMMKRLLRENLVPAGASNVLARTDVLRRIGGFDPELPYICDWDLWLRLRQEGTPAMTAGFDVAYRLHSQNAHGADPYGFLEDLERLTAKHRETGFRPDRVEISRWIASGQRRAGRRRAAMRYYLEGALRFRSPGNLVRAVALLGGESVMALGSKSRRQISASPAVEPPWLERYRAPVPAA